MNALERKNTNMKKLMLLVLAGLALFVAVSAYAANNDTQTVTFEVQAINEITVSGDPAALIINAATAGAEPDAVTDATTTYAITNNVLNKKITGDLDSAMPANVTLTIALVACDTAVSAGTVDLTDGNAHDLVTSIDLVADAAGNTITYTLDATVAAGVLASDTRTVTLTIADG